MGDTRERMTRVEDPDVLGRAEAELEEWLSIEPSPSFKAAVRHRVAAERPLAARPRWLWPAAALAALAGAAVVLVSGPGPQAGPRPSAATTSAVVPSPAREAAAAHAASSAPPPARAATRRSRPAPPARDPAVIVPRGEEQRIAAYSAAMMAGLPASLPEVPVEVTIAPLEIEPLAAGGGL